MLTASFIVQVIAALSIPLALVVVVMGRTTSGNAVRLRDVRMAILYCVIPTALLLALRAVIPWWIAMFAVALAAVLSFVRLGNSE